MVNITESSELHQKVDKILKRVESIDNFIPWLVRPNVPTIRKELLKFFNKRKNAAKVFLALDGKRNVSDVVKYTGILQPNVSDEIKTLLRLGLIELSQVGKSTVYKKNKIDSLLNLSKELDKLQGSSNPEETINNKNNLSVEEKDVSKEGNTGIVENTEPDK